MAKPAKAFLDGLPVLDSGASWTIRHGIAPSFQHFELTRENADKLLEGGLRQVTLELANGTKIKNLLILVRAPTPNPKTARVLVTDRRWYWQHIVIDKAYNQRRHIGVQRIGGDGNILLDPIVPTVDYEPWSLQGQTTAWKAKTVLKDVADEIVRLEKEAGFNFGGIAIPSVGVGSTVEIENLNLQGSATMAMAQAVAYVPGLRLTVDPGGTTRFYSIGKDAKAIQQIDPEFWDEGSILANFTEFNRVRPREIKVYFDIEAEVRFDFEENLDAGRTTALSDERLCDNVLPLTDWALRYRGELLTQNAWVKIDNDLFQAWKEMPNGKQLTPRLIRGLMVPHHDFFWNQFLRSGLDDEQADWSSRFGSIQMNWRTTFRLPRRWVDRYRSLYAYRVATRDPITGTRAPATAWHNFFVVGTTRTITAPGGGGIAQGAGGRAYGYNVTPLKSGIATGITNANTPSASPSKISIIDHDQGVFRIDMIADKFRVREMMMPGQILNIPGDDILAHMSFNSRSLDATRTQFDPNFDAIFLFTLTPGTAPQKRHLYEVVIKPGDVRDVLPNTLARGLGSANGPPLEIKIGSGIETARLAWNDRLSGVTEAIFSSGAAVSQESKRGLCINDDTSKSGGASLQSIAKAAAAQVYASYADRYQGASTTDQVPDMILEGLMEQFTQFVDSNAVAGTQVSMEDWQDFQIDRQAFMDPGARRFINKIAGVNK